MKLKRFFTALIVCSVVAACSPVKKVTVTIERAPMISLPSDANNIGIVNMVASEKSSQMYVESDFLYDGAARDGSNAICDAIAATLTKKTSFAILPVIYTGSNENIHREPYAPSVATAEKWCNEQGCQALFVVEYFFAEMQKDVVESSNVDAAGNPVFVATMNGRVEACVYVFIKNAGGGVTMLEPYYRDENLTVSGTGSSKSDAKSAMGSKRSLVTNWGAKTGSDYAYWFTPDKYNTKRNFFASGNEDFKNAYRFVKAGNFTEASQLVLKHTNVLDVQEKAKAFYNLAVISECSGDLSKAISYVELSLQTYRLEEAIGYKIDLGFLLN